MPENVDDKTLLLLKDAFKRFLKEQLGPIEDKPPFELSAWSLALLEVASEVRSYKLSLEDKAIDSP